MNKYDEIYDIRCAQMEEIPLIMSFIDSYWRKNHILSRDRIIFDFQYVVDGRVNFIIAINRKDNEIHGIYGFVPSASMNDVFDIWGALWMVREDVALPMLGLELVRREAAIIKPRNKIDIGLNPNTSVLILGRAFRQHMEKMKHFYCLSNKTDFKIAVINHPVNFDKVGNNRIKIKKLLSIDEVVSFIDLKKYKSQIPYKDAWYIERRYYGHPLWNYDLWGLSYDKDRSKALLITRIQELDGEKVMRIIDYIGEQICFSGLYDFFSEQLNHVEYIDFYCYGMNEEYILSAGMVERTEKDTNIIPNYFSPFEQKNIDIWCGFFNENVLICKGDGDQDRPN